MATHSDDIIIDIFFIQAMSESQLLLLAGSLVNTGGGPLESGGAGSSRCNGTPDLMLRWEVFGGMCVVSSTSS